MKYGMSLPWVYDLTSKHANIRRPVGSAAVVVKLC